MSLVFKVVPKENKKIEEIKNLSVNEFLEFMGDNYDFLYDDEEFLKEKIGNNVLLLGKKLVSSRGLEFYLNEECFEVRASVPSTTKDWGVISEFLKDFLNKIDGKLIDEDDEILTVEDINCEEKVLRGIELLESYNLKEEESVGLLGVNGITMSISKKMLDEIIESENKVKTFDEMVEKVFHSPAYFARQQFLKIKDKLVGYYSFGCDYDIVLPLTPVLSYENMKIEEEHGKISNWLLMIFLGGEEIIQLNYQEAIKKIKDYKKLDDNQIEISAKTKEELKEIFEIK
ncbi:MAG: DUF4299 family protein [Fusobacterium sp.]|nr:DUF4299 family protein [Fusobacterium sp.]